MTSNISNNNFYINNLLRFGPPPHPQMDPAGYQRWLAAIFLQQPLAHPLLPQPQPIIGRPTTLSQPITPAPPAPTAPARPTDHLMHHPDMRAQDALLLPPGLQEQQHILYQQHLHQYQQQQAFIPEPSSSQQQQQQQQQQQFLQYRPPVPHQAPPIITGFQGPAPAATAAIRQGTHLSAMGFDPQQWHSTTPRLPTETLHSILGHVSSLQRHPPTPISPAPGHQQQGRTGTPASNQPIAPCTALTAPVPRVIHAQDTLINRTPRGGRPKRDAATTPHPARPRQTTAPSLMDLRPVPPKPAQPVGSAALIPDINLADVRPHRLQWDAYCPVCGHARACLRDGAGRILDVEPPTTCCGERSANGGMVYEFLSALNILPKCPDELWNLADVSDAELRDKARAANRALQMGHFITERGALNKPVSELERLCFLYLKGNCTFLAARSLSLPRVLLVDNAPSKVIRQETMAKLAEIMDRINPYVREYKQLRQLSPDPHLKTYNAYVYMRDDGTFKEDRGLCLIVNKRVDACPPGFKVFKLDAGVPKERREAAAVAAAKAAAAAASAGALAGSTLGGSGGAAASVGSGSSTDGKDDDDDGEADAGRLAVMATLRAGEGGAASTSAAASSGLGRNAGGVAGAGGADANEDDVVQGPEVTGREMREQYDKELSLFSGLIPPLCFPLLYPTGCPSWSPSLKQAFEDWCQGKRIKDAGALIREGKFGEDTVDKIALANPEEAVYEFRALDPNVGAAQANGDELDIDHDDAPGRPPMPARSEGSRKGRSFTFPVYMRAQMSMSPMFLLFPRLGSEFILTQWARYEDMRLLMEEKLQAQRAHQPPPVALQNPWQRHLLAQKQKQQEQLQQRQPQPQPQQQPQQQQLQQGPGSLPAPHGPAPQPQQDHQQELQGQQPPQPREVQKDAQQTFYLPSSFVGSPRYYRRQVAESLALMKKYKKPDFFITFTCNKDWPEIQEGLKSFPHKWNRGRTVKKPLSVYDHPIVVSRVFHRKLKAFIRDLPKVFGPLKYYTSVIEYQKRGLPHAHIVICTERKYDTPEAIDKVVSCTRIHPDAKVAELVEKHMIHGHCDRCGGKNDPSKCCYHFPQPANLQTHFNSRGYPVYKRTAADADVVAYNPFLLKKYEAHVNVEVCSASRVFHYLFKYVFKGDAEAYTQLVINEDGKEVRQKVIDEPAHYVKNRHICACEATARFYEFPTAVKHPGVTTLPYHLPSKRPERTADQDAAATDLPKGMSPLERYFARPRPRPTVTNDPHPDPPAVHAAKVKLANTTYLDYFAEYMFREQLPPSWQTKPYLRDSGTPPMYILKRADGKELIRRLELTYPSSGEIWYYRLLLHNVAAYSDIEMRTVGGVVYETFAQAARARGLVTENNEGDLVMREAIGDNYGSSTLRSLAAMLIVNGAGAQALFDKYADHLAYDLLLQHQVIASVDDLATLDKRHPKYLAQLNQAKLIIGTMVSRATGRALETLGFTRLDSTKMPDLLETYLASIDLPQAIKDFADSTPHIAENPEQLAAFNRLQPVLDRAIANKLDPSETRLFFIQGSSGRGKTYLLNHLINYMFINGGTILPCAFTGIAASSLLHGRTAHGTFAIEIKSEDEQAIQAKIRPNTKRAKFLASVHAIIWDEMAMMDRAGVEAVDRMLRVVRRCDLPFGGVVFIGCGDFKQLAPVVPGGTAHDVVFASPIHMYPDFATPGEGDGGDFVGGVDGDEYGDGDGNIGGGASAGVQGGGDDEEEREQATSLLRAFDEELGRRMGADGSMEELRRVEPIGVEERRTIDDARVGWEEGYPRSDPWADAEYERGVGGREDSEASAGMFDLDPAGHDDMVAQARAREAEAMVMAAGLGGFPQELLAVRTVPASAFDDHMDMDDRFGPQALGRGRLDDVDQMDVDPPPTHMDLDADGIDPQSWWAQHVEMVYLTKPMRDREDAGWSEFVDLTGTTPPPVGNEPDSHFALELTIDGFKHTTSVDEAIHFVYPELRDYHGNLDGVQDLHKRAIMCFHNAHVDEINSKILERVPGAAVKVQAAYRLGGNQANHGVLSDDFFATVSDNGAPPHDLYLKEGAYVLMMRNMLPDKQLLNNSPMRILRISHHKLLVEMLKTGERLAIPRLWFEIDVAFLNVKVYRLQFPVRLAYAVTVNRSQSLTLDKAALDLRTWPFTHGQLYVAVGRVRTRNDFMFLRGDDVIADPSLLRRLLTITYRPLLAAAVPPADPPSLFTDPVPDA